MNIINRIPCPPGVAAWLDAYSERRLLVLQIQAVTRSKTTATVALVFSYLLRARYGGRVNGYLRTFKEWAMAGVIT